MLKSKIIVLIILIQILPIIPSAQILDSLSSTVQDSSLSYLHLERNELGVEKAWVKTEAGSFRQLPDRTGMFRTHHNDTSCIGL